MSFPYDSAEVQAILDRDDPEELRDFANDVHTYLIDTESAP